MTQKKLSSAENFALGGSVAVASVLLSNPLERVKLLLQSQHEIVKASRMARPYQGVIDCVRRTYTTEGILPFWRGTLASCFVYFPSHALNFAFKAQLGSMFHPSNTDSNLVKFSKNVASGGIAGVLTILCVYSMGYTRIRLANDVKNSAKGGERQFKGIIDVYSKTLKSDGFVGLHRGFVVSCVGILVYRGCYFGLYDTLKPLMVGDDAGFIPTYAIAYGVTISAGLISYPFDTVHSRMLMRSGEPIKYKGSIHCASEVIRNEGYISLWRGAGVSILRGIVGAVMLPGFDKLKKLYIQWRLS